MEIREHEGLELSIFNSILQIGAIQYSKTHQLDNPGLLYVERQGDAGSTPFLLERKRNFLPSKTV